MKINPSIFKTYDIRGVYPSEVNEEVAHWLGAAFVKFIKPNKNKIFVVGRDNRLSSLPLEKKLIEGILYMGGKVIDLGLTTTPMFYWAVKHFKAEGGIQVSASHNPPEYNGFKMVKKDSIPISSLSGLLDIKNIKIDFKSKHKKPYSVDLVRVEEEYVNYIFNKIDDFSKIKDFKIVIDTANAVSGILIPVFSKKIPQLKAYHILGDLDGNFPNHYPDPTDEHNLVALKKEIKKRKADIGIAFDGDGDRVVFVDEKGNQVRGDFITALLAEELLTLNPGEKILYETRSSKIVKETIEKMGGIPILGRPGHSLIKELMRKDNILFAGELSGHFYFKEVGFFEAPLLTVLYVLKIMSKKNKPFSKIIEKFKVYYQSGEINFANVNKEEVLEKVRRKYEKESQEILTIDGLTMIFKDWWFNLRPSGTENLLRLNIEADSREVLKKKKEELIKIIEE
jgi:phosphomannomutase